MCIRDRITCSAQIPDSPVTIKMNETLATILVTNIIKNAFVHSPEDGKVTLNCLLYTSLRL